MKKLISFVTTVILIFAAGVFLITENPSVNDFSSWYVKNNPTEMGSFFDDVYEGMVRRQTKTKDYVLLTVFEIDKTRYVGIAGRFWGRNSVEEAGQTASKIIERARKEVEEKLPAREESDG